ncbi:hypothetical protein [Stakelama pacifica]|nr:hypothetical protein [Stakelama pacifica]GGO98909.1 hypothetical protein GCM10011329_31170 [Stakelama pacifica]
MTRRFVRRIDLADDAAVIAACEAAHASGHTPPEVLASQRRTGVVEVEIYRHGSGLEVSDTSAASAIG